MPMHVAPGHVELPCTADSGRCVICDRIASSEHYRRLFSGEGEPVAMPAVEAEPIPATPTRPLPDIPLAGDVVEAIARRIGADRLAKLWEEWTGKPCNCPERREAMNRATEKLLKWARWLGLV